MKLAKASLILTSLAYALIGLIFLFDPIYWASTIDIALPTPTASIDLRATYGGCMMAIAIFLFYCLKNIALVRVGLVFQVLSFGGFGAARAAGILIDGMPRPVMYYLLAAEVSGVALGLFCLSRLGKTDNI